MVPILPKEKLFRALKASKWEDFRTLYPSNLEGFRTLKPSHLEAFRALKRFFLVHLIQYWNLDSFFYIGQVRTQRVLSNVTLCVVANQSFEKVTFE